MVAAAGAATAGMGPGAALGIGAGLSILGGIMGHMDARKQGKRRAPAIEAAQRENMRLAQEEAGAYGKAGAIKQGELLAHLRRLADGQVAQRGQSDANARSAQINALAGPATAGDGSTPSNQVAMRAASEAGVRSGQSNQLDLVRALLGSQDRARGYSARSADVAASRAVIPLQERLYQLSIQRMNNQANLQNSLGNIGPGWGAVAGQVMQGGASLPLLFA